MSSAAVRAARPYVLLVDDHAPTLRVLSEVVESAGHSCKTASSATEAITCIEARRPQVVVTDLAMPNLDGLGLARWTKLRFPSLPVMLVTAQELDAPAQSAMGRTFTGIFSKPVNVARFLGQLDRLMPVARIGEATLTGPMARPYDATVRVARGVAQPG